VVSRSAITTTVLTLLACGSEIRVVEDDDGDTPSAVGAAPTTTTTVGGAGGNGSGVGPGSGVGGNGSGVGPGSGAGGNGSGAGGTTLGEQIEQLCGELCDAQCVYFGRDCSGTCTESQLDPSCAEPYLAWLECLAECDVSDLCPIEFEPFSACVNPYQCGQEGLGFEQNGNTCSNTATCNDGHVGSMTCSPSSNGKSETCDCFFDGAFTGSCTNPSYTQCSMLFPCCQPLWAP
jgi:hypothetical protein